MRKAAQQHQLGEKKLTHDALTLLEQHAWPGNIRELENLCQQLTIMHPAEQISAADLPPLQNPAYGRTSTVQPPGDWQQALAATVAEALARHDSDIYQTLLARFEQTLIDTALHASQYHKQRAAERLGIGRNTLARKTRKI